MEEEVVGVLKECRRCDRKSVHVGDDTICRTCRKAVDTWSRRILSAIGVTVLLAAVVVTTTIAFLSSHESSKRVRQLEERVDGLEGEIDQLRRLLRQ